MVGIAKLKALSDVPRRRRSDKASSRCVPAIQEGAVTLPVAGPHSGRSRWRTSPLSTTQIGASAKVVGEEGQRSLCRSQSLVPTNSRSPAQRCVKGEHIEDGERDPDTIAEEQRRRSAAPEAGRDDGKRCATPDVPDLAPRPSSANHSARPESTSSGRATGIQTTPRGADVARVNLGAMTPNTGWPPDDSSAGMPWQGRHCASRPIGREAAPGLAQAAFKEAPGSRPPLPARRRESLFPTAEEARRQFLTP